jgi:hypothetical protein
MKASPIPEAQQMVASMAQIVVDDGANTYHGQVEANRRTK